MTEPIERHDLSDDLLSREMRVTSADPECRRIELECSNEEVDSHETILDSEWNLERYQLNPVALWAHQRTELPIGHLENVRCAEGKLKGTLVLGTKAANPRAEEVRHQFIEKHLRGVSVGFKPSDAVSEFVDGKTVMRLTAPELFEVSVLPVPSNPKTLAQLRSRAFGGTVEQEQREMGASSSEKSGTIWRALREKYPEPEVPGSYRSLWICDVFDDEVVFSVDGLLHAAPYTYDQDSATAEIGDAYRVRASYEAIPSAEPTERAAVPYSATKPVEASKWDGAAAERRLRKWAGDDKKKLARGFAWTDGKVLKLPHHDVQNGELVVTEKAVIAACNAVQGSRGGVKLPAADLPGVKEHLGKHCRQFKRTAPWDRGADTDSPAATPAAVSQETPMAEDTSVTTAAFDELSKRAADLDAKLGKATADAEALRAVNQSLETERSGLQAQVAKLNQEIAERELDVLVGKKITPADKAVALKVALTSRDVFDELVASFRARTDMVQTRTAPTIPDVPPEPSSLSEPAVGATPAQVDDFKRQITGGR